MKEFIEKLIGRLEELKTFKLALADAMSELMKKDKLDNYISKEEVVEIVNQLAEEYKDKEYCWQECASTEHCKECSRLGNGDIDYFESIDDWAECLPTIDAGELFGNGWIPCSEKCPPNNTYCLITDWDGDIRIEKHISGNEWFAGFNYVIAWKPLPAPYQPKGE